MPTGSPGAKAVCQRNPHLSGPTCLSVPVTLGHWGAWLCADSLVDAKRSPGVTVNHEGPVFMAATMLPMGPGTF